MQVTDFCKRLSLITLVELLVFVLFVSLSLYIAPYHEVWADEVQAFLIARDADWITLLTQIPSQESHTILWHILLKILILVFGDGLNITYVSIVIMSATVLLIVFWYDISWLYKVLIPFSYFFLYQYNIVARNYCLAYLALAVTGLCYKGRHKKIWRYTLSLAFLAETASFYVPVAATLGCFYLYEIYTFYRQDYKKYIAPLIVLLSVGISILWQLFPVNHFSYMLRVDIFSLFFVSDAFFTFYDHPIISILFLGAFIILFIWRLFNIIRHRVCVIRSFIYFVILWSVFLPIFYVALPNVQHKGLIFGLFLFSFYIFFEKRARQTSLFFTAVLFLQIYWAAGAVIYDREHLVSPQNEVLNFLRKNNLLDQKVFVLGYQTLPLQMLLPRDKLFLLGKDETLYYTWTIKDYDSKDNYYRLANLKSDVAVLDFIVYSWLKRNPKINLDDYEQYPFKAALANKTGLGYNQSLFVFVKKTKLQQKNF